MLLSRDGLLVDALIATHDNLTTEMVVVNKCAQNSSAEQHDVSLKQASLYSDEHSNLSINQEPIKNTPFHDELIVQNQSPSIFNNAQSIESNSSHHAGCCWQAIYAFFNRIYNAIIRILRQWKPNSHYSHQLYQPVHNVQNVVDLLATRVECTNSV